MATSEEHAGPWRVFAVVAGATVVSTLNFSLIFIALADIEADFGPEAATTLSWAFTGYAIVAAALLVPAGWAADRFGRRRTFLVGLCVFAVGSATVAIAPTPLVLVLARLVQAAGTATVAPSALALLLSAFPLGQRSTAVGAFGALSGITFALGPVVGGLLVGGFGWRAAFAANVPVALLTAFAAHRRLVESRPEPDRRRPDLVGALALMVGLMLAVGAIVSIEEQGGTSPAVVTSALVATGLLAWFVLRSRQHPGAIVDPTLFASRNFRLANVLSIVFAGNFAATYLVLVQYLTDVWELGEARAGVTLALIPLLGGPLSLVSGRLADRVGHRRVLVPGTLLVAAGAGWFAVAAPTSPDPLIWLGAIGLYGTGIGFSFAAIESAAVHDLPDRRLAVGGSVHRIFNEIGTALSIAVIVVLVDAGGGDLGRDDLRRALGLTVLAGLTAAVIATGIDTRRPRRPTAGSEAVTA